LTVGVQLRLWRPTPPLFLGRGRARPSRRNHGPLRNKYCSSSSGYFFLRSRHFLSYTNLPARRAKKRVRVSVTSRIVFINSHAARYGWFFGRRMPRGYRLASKFWGSGLIDRTGTLNTGFPYENLYPIPSLLGGPSPSLDQLCDEMGKTLLREATETGKQIQILWSGGIDSTAAMIGLLKAATTQDALNRLEVILSEESIKEYPSFYKRFVQPLRPRFVKAPVTVHLDPAKLVVTGEHGDQIFGSARAMRYVTDGRAFEPYKLRLPEILAESLDSASDADTVVRYLEPFLAASPVELHTIFDAFWWINFALKWQIVGLRLAVFRVNDVRPTFDALRHYFTDPSFQLWSFANRDQKIKETWESYKMPLKDYIFRFAGDNDYRVHKTKVASLKHVFLGDVMHPAPSYRVLMDQDFVPVFWEFRKNVNSARIKLPARNIGR
jgi:hypothetical protein